MCKVKFGKHLKTESDIQNMIIGIILRQRSKFRQEDIFMCSEQYSKGASMDINKSMLNTFIENNLDFVLRCGKIRCMDGVYSPFEVERCTIK